MAAKRESDLEKRRKRLKFRAWHRGTRESDLIIGNFINLRLNDLNKEDCAWFESLLEEQEQELLGWITGKYPLPQKYDTPLMRALMKINYLPQGKGS
jgi:antitoxin CptB